MVEGDLNDLPRLHQEEFRALCFLKRLIVYQSGFQRSRRGVVSAGLKENVLSFECVRVRRQVDQEIGLRRPSFQADEISLTIPPPSFAMSVSYQ